MFKPTLKRSKLSAQHHTSLSFNNIQIQNITRLTAPINPKSNLLILPTDFIDGSYRFQSTHSDSQTRIVSPINSYDLPYPQQVKHEIEKQIDESKMKGFELKNRGIGSEYGIFWFHFNEFLFLWNYELTTSGYVLKIQRKFQFIDSIFNVAISDIAIFKRNSNSLNQEPDFYTLAMGFKETISLYQINSRTLEIENMEIRIRIDYGQTLQKMKFTETNELLITGDEGYLTRVSFSPSQYKSRSKAPSWINKITRKPAKLQYSIKSFFEGQKTLITESIITAPHTNKIYVLMREERFMPALTTKYNKLKSLFSGQIINLEKPSYITKFINVYNVGLGQTLNFEGTIREQKLISALEQNYSKIRCQFQQILTTTNHSSSLICSINIPHISDDPEEEYKFNQLSVNLITRHVATIQTGINLGDKKLSFEFIDLPNQFPSTLQPIYAKDMELSLIRKIKLQDLRSDKRGDRSVFLVESRGYGNINFLSNQYCYYIDDQVIQFIKFTKMPNQIVQFQENNNKAWALFNKKKITILRILKLQEIILIYVESQKHEISSLFSDIKSRALNNRDTLKRQLESKGIYNQKLRESINKRHKLDIDKKDPAVIFLEQKYANVRSQEKIYHILMPVLEISHLLSNVVGSNRFCQALMSILIYIIGHKSQYKNFESFSSQKNWNLWDYYPINSDIKDITKRQLEKYTKTKKNKRSLASQEKVLTLQDWHYRIFQQNQPHICVIQKQIEDTLWSLLLNFEYTGQRVNYNAKTDMNYSSYWLFLMTTVTQILSEIKEWKIVDFGQKSRTKNSLVQKLQIIQKLIQRKIAISKSTYENLRYFQERSIRESKDQSLKIYPTISTAASHQKNQINSDTVPNQYERVRASESTSELENKISKLIPKILSGIQLYQILNEKKREEALPNFGEFLTSLSERKKIKDELIKTFQNKRLSETQLIDRFNKLLPEMGLQADLAFDKWFFETVAVEKGQQVRKIQAVRKMKPQQINYQKLVACLDSAKIIKVRPFFMSWPPAYVKLLLYREQQLNAEYSVLRKSREQKNKEREKAITQNDQVDEQKLYEQLKQGYEKEIQEISRMIICEAKLIVKAAYQSSGEEFVITEKYLLEMIGVLEEFPSSVFLEEICRFMQQQKYFIEKAYYLMKRLELRNKKNYIGKIGDEKTDYKTYLMSSSKLIELQKTYYSDIIDHKGSQRTQPGTLVANSTYKQEKQRPNSHEILDRSGKDPVK